VNHIGGASRATMIPRLCFTSIRRIGIRRTTTATANLQGRSCRARHRIVEDRRPLLAVRKRCPGDAKILRPVFDRTDLDSLHDHGGNGPRLRRSSSWGLRETTRYFVPCRICSTGSQLSTGNGPTAAHQLAQSLSGWLRNEIRPYGTVCLSYVGVELGAPRRIIKSDEWNLWMVHHVVGIKA
jgi:hypothetical protein